MAVQDAHQIRARLRAFIDTNLARDFRDVDLDKDSLVDSGMIDSLTVETLLAFIEKDLGVKISDRDVQPEYFDTLDAMTAFVASKVKR